MRADDTLPRRLALGGIAAPLLFGTAVVTTAALRPGYSHTTSFISDLGASQAPYAPLMNFLGFVPSGLLLVAFAVALSRTLPRTWPAVAATFLLAVFGTGVSAAGIASCDPGCPQAGGSLENAIHNLLGPISFMSMIAGVLLLAVALRRLPGWRPIALYSVATAVLAGFFLSRMVASLEARDLTGLWQRLMLATLFLWCIVLGWRVHREPR